MLFKRTAAATALLVSLATLSPVIKASDVHRADVHRSELRSRVRHAATPDRSAVPEEFTAPEEYRLRMHHLHTGEDIDIVYRVGDEYIPSALEKLDYFLRDHRTGDVSNYDPREFDTLHELMAKLGRTNGVIDIVCGYRTPWSNNFLRTRGPNTGVAEHSQHMLGHAIDIRVPGVSTLALRNAALSLHAGGVGYYPVSQFVHVDVGPVRQWAFR